MRVSKILKIFAILLVFITSRSFGLILEENFKDYKIKCKEGDLKSCVNAGLAYLSGVGVKKDYQKAREYFKKSCDKCQNSGCNYLGDIYANGLGVKKDYKKAYKFYKKACENDYMPACDSLGLLYLNGYGVKKDSFKAVEYFTNACYENNYMESCNNIAILYMLGKSGVNKNYKRAKKLFERSCYLNSAKGCMGLGDIYKDGYGVEVNKSIAAHYYEKACACSELDENTYKACLNSALIYYHLGKYNKAKKLLEITCNNIKSACAYLGMLFYKGKGIEKDIKKGLILLKKSCDNNFSFACYNLGVIYLKDVKDYTKAIDYLKKACKLGDKESCKIINKIETMKNKKQEKTKQ